MISNLTVSTVAHTIIDVAVRPTRVTSPTGETLNIKNTVEPIFTAMPEFSYFCNSEEAGKVLIAAVQNDKLALVKHLTIVTPISTEDREKALFEAVSAGKLNMVKALFKTKSYVCSFGFLEKCILASSSHETLDTFSLLLDRDELNQGNFGYYFGRDCIFHRNIEALKILLKKPFVSYETFLELMNIAVIQDDSIELIATFLSSREILMSDLEWMRDAAEDADEYDTAYLLKEWIILTAS